MPTARSGRDPFSQLDRDSARDVLREVERLATHDLAASFADADRNPPVFDAATGDVTLPPSFLRSYQAYADGGWDKLDLPESLGGIGAPPTLRWAAHEMILGANPAIFMFGSGAGFAAILHRNGTAGAEAVRRARDRAAVGRAPWCSPSPTPAPTSAPRRATATLAARRHLAPQGVKRFITSAEWDWPENIFHLVLARPVGVEGAGGPGTKGLSLFLVPKFHVDLETGELGERNGVQVTNLEKKMGLKVSTTCELTFGEHEPAVGTLVGGVHDGIAQMFQVIENARMFVGAKAISTLSTGYLNALEYAKDPRAGAGPHPDDRQDRAARDHRAPPRRTPHAHAPEGLGRGHARAGAVHREPAGPRSSWRRTRATDDEVPVRLNDLLLPIVKGYGSEKAYELLASSLQVLGGSGFTQDYPVEQYLRDAKIDTLYEGTTTIQGLDLFFRKIVRDQGQALGGSPPRCRSSPRATAATAPSPSERELLGAGPRGRPGHRRPLRERADEGSVDAAREHLQGRASTRPACYGPRRPRRRLAAAAPGRGGARGARRRPRRATGPSTRARWPRPGGSRRTSCRVLTAQRALAEAADLSLMELDEAAF